MKGIRVIAAIAVALFAFVSTSPAEAKRHHYKKHYTTTYSLKHGAKKQRRYAAPAFRAGSDACTYDNNGRVLCNVQVGRSASTDANGNNSSRATGRYRGANIWDRISIPTPSGTWRVAQSCGHRLAAYWGLGGGLDKATTWAHRFERTSHIGPRVAAVTSHHVLGVIGGREGAWRVVSFNGDGSHGNVEFTTSHLSGTLVDTTRPRTASR